MESPGLLHEIALVLRQLGGGEGADPINAVPRFLIPAAFWAALLLASAYRARASSRDRLVAIAAGLGLSRELFQFTFEYGSYRGLFPFEAVVWFYPPFEHAFQLASELVAGYAFLSSVRDDRRRVRGFLAVGLAVTALLYLVTAPAWAAFVRGAAPLHPAARVEFAQHWGDLAFRSAATVLLGAVVAGLATAHRNGSARLATFAFSCFLLDHALMVVAILAGLRPLWFLSPLRHNLHTWAVPALLGVYWWELAEELRAADARAAAAERLRSLGLLAGGVAHDFNNLLTVIAVNVRAALPSVRSSAGAAALGDAADAAARGGELVDQLLAFSGGRAVAPVHLDLGVLAADTARLLRTRVPAGVALDVACAPGVAWVAGDRSQLGQVVLNLIVNATQAMRGRPGTIRIETGLEAVAGSSRAFLQVSDQGIGMTEAQRARVFDPLFTTRERGHGLGLAVVDRVVRAHFGAIQVETAPGVGSTFRVLLPAIPPGTPVPAAASAEG